jgi:hypothetical protein
MRNLCCPLPIARPEYCNPQNVVDMNQSSNKAIQSTNYHSSRKISNQNQIFATIIP